MSISRNHLDEDAPARAGVDGQEHQGEPGQEGQGVLVPGDRSGDAQNDGQVQGDHAQVDHPQHRPDGGDQGAGKQSGHPERGDETAWGERLGIFARSRVRPRP